MKKLVAMSVCVFMFTSVFAVNPKSVGMSGDKLDSIDNVILDEISNGNIPHGAALVARDGKVVYEKYFGQASPNNSTPLANDTIFRIASFTKAVTSVAALMMYEEGKFLMNDPISLYIPGFTNMDVGESDGNGNLTLVPAENPITVRDILTHKSGLIYQPFIEDGNPLKDLYLNEATHKIFPWENDETLEQYVNRMAALPLYRQPGTEVTYGVSTDVLGRLVEIWSGQSLNDFFQDRIFGPLDMNDTSFYLPSDQVSRLPDLYRLEDDGTIALWITPDVDPQVVGNGPNKLYSGAAGLLSTPRDFLNFCEMIRQFGRYKNKTVLSPQSVDMMKADQLNGTPLPEFLRIHGDSTGFGVGVRFERGQWDGLETQGTVAFAGINWTRYWIDSEEDLVVMSFSQVFRLELSGYTHKIKNVAFGAIEKAKKHPKKNN